MKSIIKTTTLVKWKELQDFPGYFISNNGLIRDGKALMNLRIKDYNYRYVVVYKKEKGVATKNRKDIHTLVWDYFGNTPRTKGFEVHHKDEDKSNNHIDNLELIPMLVHRRLHSKKFAR